MISFFLDAPKGRWLKVSFRRVWLLEIAANHGKVINTLNLILLSGEKHLEMNRAYLGHHYPTDVITFDLREIKEDGLNGEIYLSRDTIKTQAKDLGIPFEDELDRIMVHGLLHLIGFNDQSELERKEMKTQEDEALSKRTWKWL